MGLKGPKRGEPPLSPLQLLAFELRFEAQDISEKAVLISDGPSAELSRASEGRRLPAITADTVVVSCSELRGVAWREAIETEVTSVSAHVERIVELNRDG